MNDVGGASQARGSTRFSSDGLAIELIGPVSGRPLVWAHGLTSSRRAADTALLFDWSTSVGVRLVRYDARGHGESIAPTSAASCAWESLAVDLLGVMDAVGLERAAIGGASMGSATAVAAALLAAERVDRLVLATPPAAWASREPQRARYAEDAEMVRRRGLEPYLARLRTAPVPAVLEGIGERLRSDAIDRIGRADRHTLADILGGAALSDLPSPERLSTIGAPTLVLAWTGDPGHPLSTATAVSEAIPNATIDVASRPADLRRWPRLVGEALLAPSPSS